MASDWYEEMEKAEQEYDVREYELAQEYSRGYEQGRADAEKDFQNSDYWNDYLAKVIKDSKADAILECINILAESEDTILTDKQYHTLMDLVELKEHK